MKYLYLTNPLTVLERCCVPKDEKLTVCVNFIDIGKAIKEVSHIKLSPLLKDFRIRVTLLLWINDILAKQKGVV